MTEIERWLQGRSGDELLALVMGVTVLGAILGVAIVARVFRDPPPPAGPPKA